MSYYLLTLLAMIAFAGNTLFCRMALGPGHIDATSFTAIRLGSGAIVLSIIMLMRQRGRLQFKFNVISSLMLFCYAIFFSFSYIGLTTGTGALILFGSVQLCMIIYGLIKGERPTAVAWAGIALAFGGLIYLLLPSVSAPPLDSALLMIVAGIAWGAYSLRGRGSKAPIANTGMNFIGTLPLVVLAYLFISPEVHINTAGVMLAILSGTLASAIGYAIWYSALPHLMPTNAATVQLSVPVISAFAGILFLAEPISLRLLVSSLAILGGIYLTIRFPRKTAP